jgi:hypothetical protein
MEPPGQPAPAPRATQVIRASDQDREATAQRLQAAFAEGRLDDEEFDQRMRSALVARTSTELDQLAEDLPATSAAAPAARRLPGKPPGRFAIAYKGSIRRGGRWRVPERLTTVIYKGGGRLDLRAAELTAQVTTLFTVAYKSRIDILVPPGVRVEVDGLGVSKGWSPDEELEHRLPPDAPVIHIKGVAYKGTIEASSRPPGPDDRPAIR